MEDALEQLENAGATVEIGPASTPEAIARSERDLGFPLPASYKEFLSTFGAIAIEKRRTWFFYGVPEDTAHKAEYVAHLAPAIESYDAEGHLDDHGESSAYFPRRYFILFDAGQYGNVASGLVWDADLEHIRWIDGSRWMDRDEHHGDDYWTVLIAQLQQIYPLVASEPSPAKKATRAPTKKKPSAKPARKSKRAPKA